MERERKRNILLVGGAGYIGTVMTDHFLRKEWGVRCFDQLIYKNESCVWPFLSDPGYEFVRGDLRDASQYGQALSGVDDVVILAGLVGDPITKKYPEQSDAINLKGIRSFLDVLQSHPVQRVVFISTCSNYGMVDKDEAVDEDYPLAPLSLYAKHKVEIEKQLLALKGKVGFRPTILRFATAFGVSPRMRFDLTVNEFVRELYLGKELLVYDAKTWRPYCHVRDFARAVESVLIASPDKVTFEVFNVGCDENNFTKEMIVQEVERLLPNSRVRYQEHGSDPRNYRVNFDKIRETLDFRPRETVSMGIAETLGALRQGLFAHVDEQKHFYGNYQVYD